MSDLDETIDRLPLSLEVFDPGYAYPLVLDMTDADGSRVDWSQFDVRMTLKSDDNQDAAVTVTEGNGITIEDTDVLSDPADPNSPLTVAQVPNVKFTGAQTSAFAGDRVWYFIDLRPAGGDWYVALRGRLKARVVSDLVG